MGRRIRSGREGLLRWIVRRRIGISVLGAVVFYLLASPSPAALLMGTPVVFLGEALRTWASGYLRKNETVCRSGPYRYIRHPLYLGNFFLGLGFVLMGGRMELLPLYGLAFGCLYGATVRHEEERLRERFGAAYEAYRRQVPGWIPRRNPGPGGPEGFAWRLVWKHREHRTWLGILFGLSLMALRPWLPLSLWGS